MPEPDRGGGVRSHNFIKWPKIKVRDSEHEI